MLYELDTLKNRIDLLYDEIVDLRRYLHMHPELSEHEVHTAEKIGAELDKLKIPYKKDVAGNGIYATISGKDPRHGIAIRADIDALPIHEKTEVPFQSCNPGVMHACGHDIHTAILLGTARILNERKDQLPGSVRLIFQPSEETIGGARQMIEAGVLEDPQITSVLGLHVEPSVPVGSVQLIPGTMNAAACEFSVTVTGKACHGAHPDRGIDALLPACTMVSSLQSIITRRLDPADTALITVGSFHGGQKGNIISGEVEFSGIIRTLNLENREFLKKELETLCRSIASAYQTNCEIHFQDSYPSLENDPHLFALVQQSCTEALGADHLEVKAKPSLGADDFSYFCHSAHGLYYNIGVKAEDAKEVFPLHSDYFCPDEGCIKTGILTEVVSVLNILEEESKKW